MLMPFTGNAAPPLFVSVALSTPLVVPTGTPPNFRLVGLTAAAGVTVNVFDFETPFAVALIDAVDFAPTAVVTTWNGADVAPTGTLMVADAG